MVLTAESFYDEWAEQYELIFAGWWPFAQASGAAVAARLTGLGVRAPARVLDCSCGIGTQAIPLAQHGFAVTGTDVSARSVARARREADDRGVTIELAVADMRHVDRLVHGPFDAVITIGNSLPHLLTDDDLRGALAATRRSLRPGGVFVASIRDYEALVISRAPGTPGVYVDDDHGVRIFGQAWQWSDDRRYVTIHVFVMVYDAESGQWRPIVRATTYRTLRRDELTAALAAVGYETIEWHEPDHDRNQPIVTATA